MDRALDWLGTTLEWIAEGRSFATVVVLDARGSTPRKRGVRALVDASGRIAGTVGGGAVEAEAQRRAAAACRTGSPEILEVPLQGLDASEEEPLCGGVVRLLIDPNVGAWEDVYRAAARDLAARRGGVLVTDVRPGDPSVVSVQWCPGEPPAAAPTTERILEPLVPDPRLLIVGGGHIGQALAAQAVALGFDVTVLDDRPEYTDPALYPERVATRCGALAEEVGAFLIAEDTYVVIVTRGHRHDAEALAASIRSPAAYIGMIGSRRKVARIRAELIRRGLATEAELDRVLAPVGLDIGAVTVPEIATSIAAQLVAVRRKGRAGAERARGRP